MSNETATESNEAVATTEPTQQMQLQINDADAPIYYASTARVSGTAEELTVDLSRGIQPTSKQNVSTLKVDARVIMSPWAAKRLALALGQAVTRYEKAYGELEVDPRKRLKSQK